MPSIRSPKRKRSKTKVINSMVMMSCWKEGNWRLIQTSQNPKVLISVSPFFFYHSLSSTLSILTLIPWVLPKYESLEILYICDLKILLLLYLSPHYAQIQLVFSFHSEQWYLFYLRILDGVWLQLCHNSLWQFTLFTCVECKTGNEAYIHTELDGKISSHA